MPKTNKIEYESIYWKLYCSISPSNVLKIQAKNKKKYKLIHAKNEKMAIKKKYTDRDNERVNRGATKSAAE